jgi:hypothetical protein
MLLQVDCVHKNAQQLCWVKVLLQRLTYSQDAPTGGLLYSGYLTSGT